MAQEVKLNIEVDGSVKVSDYSFQQGEQATIYFRMIRKNYILDTQELQELTIKFVNNSDASNNYTVIANQSNVVTKDGEKLISVQLPVNLVNSKSLFTANPTIKLASGTNKLPTFVIAIYEKDSVEMNYVRQVINQFNALLANYAGLIKTDLLNTPNGVAMTDSKNKVLEENLSNKFKLHTEMLITNSEPHGIRLNHQGQMEYLDPADNKWKLVQNQHNPNIPTVPPVITVKDSLVTVTHDPTTLLSLQKWDYDEINNVSYFQNFGNRFNGSTFTVDKAGRYTLYYKTTNGKEYLVYFDVVATDLAIIPPTITIVRGVATVKHNTNTKVTLQKFAKGNQVADWFDTNGEIIYNNTFEVTEIGTHTLFYQVEDGRKYVMLFEVTQTQLPPVNIMPTIKVEKGIVTVEHDSTTKLGLQKYDFGEKDVTYFQTDGKTIIGKTFPVDKVGIYTYYYKTVAGDEFALPVNVKVEDLPEVVAPEITVFNGVVTVKFIPTMKVIMKKWDSGIRSVQHFSVNGIILTGETFEVTVAGDYTVYYKLEDGREFVEAFNVTQADLKQPHVIPNVSKGDSKFVVEFKPTDDVILRKWDEGVRDIAYFQVSGKTVNTSTITVTKVGQYTFYYKLRDGEEHVINVDMRNQDMKQVPPIISISKGVATVTHGEFMLLDIQKWDVGSRTIQYFQTDGNIVDDGRFLVNTAGSHSLYYRATWGDEFVIEFDVKESQLAQPHVPPTITVKSGVVTVEYSPDDVIVAQKWSSGNRSVDYFRVDGNGTEFTGNKFNVTTIGTYTLYYKLDNERDYVKTFIVQSNMLPTPFVPPTIDLNRGVATVKNHSTTVLGSQKWDIGSRDVAYFSTNGNNLVNFKFTYSEVGIYTVYTKLEDEREFVTEVEVTETDLPLPRIDPTITIVDSVATIKYDNRVVAVEQKWAVGSKSLAYFETDGNIITGNTFEVSEVGTHTFYYEREDGEKYIFIFNVEEGMLRIPVPTITFDKRIATVTYADGVNVTLEKFAEGIRDVAYFTTDGTVIQNHQFPVTVAGTYTLYYKVRDGREFVSVFMVSADDLNLHTPPTITVEGDAVTVSYLPTVESQVTSKKWDTGNRTPEYFETAGNELASNTFTAHSLGVNSYYYEYRGEGFVIEFFVWIPPTFIKKYGVVRVQNG